MVSRSGNESPTSEGYWRLGEQFLILAENACRELVRSKNAGGVLTPLAPVTEVELHEATKWSDFSVGVPALFNLFHGVELLLKGFIVSSGSASTGHRLTQLLAKFEAVCPESPFGVRVRSLVLKVDPASPFGRFLAANQLSIDSWYEALKYPASRTGQKFVQRSLQFGGRDSVGFWESCAEVARDIRHDAVQLSRTAGHA